MEDPQPDSQQVWVAHEPIALQLMELIENNHETGDPLEVSIARATVARKLAKICWKRLKHFQQINAA